MAIHDKQGYTPIHYAAYKNMEKAVEILISFVFSEKTEESAVASSSGPHGGSGDTGDKNAFIKKIKQKQ
jgi:ankyrin repeat protein